MPVLLIGSWYDAEKFLSSSAYRNWEFSLLYDDGSNNYKKINGFIDVSTADPDEDPDN